MRLSLEGIANVPPATLQVPSRTCLKDVSGDHQNGHGSVPKVPEFTRFASDKDGNKSIYFNRIQSLYGLPPSLSHSLAVNANNITARRCII